MYFVTIFPKRGTPYHAPSREMCVGWKLKRDACAEAENQSKDDSVCQCVVFQGTVCDDLNADDVTYVDGVRQ